MTDFWKNFLNSIKRCKIELIVLVAVVAVDLISKQIIQSTMYEGQSIAVIPGFFYLYYIKNPAAAYGSSFGLDKLVGKESVVTVFIVITILAIIAFSFFLLKESRRSWMFRLAFALIIGGAFGNLVDRIAMQSVRDFLQIVVFNTAIFGSFNVADAALVAGVIAFMCYILFLFDKDEKKAELSSIKQENIENSEEFIETEQNPPQTCALNEKNSAENQENE